MALKEFVRDKSVEKASEAIDLLAERAKAALRELAERAGEAGDELPRRDLGRLAGDARDQASELASDLYARGQRTAVAVGRQVEEQPYVALALVAFFGVALGFMLRRG